MSALERLNQLISQKEELEKELIALGEILKQNKIGMDDSLIDFAGFPRADIDIPLVRDTRIKIIRGKNDLKDLMSKIEEALHLYHSEGKGEEKVGTEKLMEPFAEVNTITVNGPAYKAGFRRGDLITKLDVLDKSNIKEFQQLAEIVNQSEEKSIEIQILRGSYKATRRHISFNLTPSRDWAGNETNSLLGCHIVPYTQN